MDAVKKAFSPKERNSDAMQAFGFRLRKQFSQNQAYRRMKEIVWLEDLRSYKGLYDPDVRIEPGNSKVYPKIPRSKVNIVLSRLHEMLFPSQDKNWEIKPTPEPKISREIVTQIAMALVRPDPQTGVKIIPTANELQLAIKAFAKITCEKMSSVIDDQLTEMEYPEETKKVLRSGLMYGTGLMKGPMVSKRTKRRWNPLPDGSDYEEEVETEEVPDLQFVRIWDWYPDMTGTEIEKMTGCFERHVMTKHDLRKLMKREDFYDDVIRTFIEERPDGDYVPLNWEVDLQVIEIEAGTGKTASSTSATGSSADKLGTTSSQLGKKYEVLEFWGYADGNDLEACGLDIPDVELEYAANVWLLGNKVIKTALFDKALDQYKVFYYEKDETSIFGEGLIRVMRGSTLAIGAGSRMVLDNGACLIGETEVYRNHKCPHGGEKGDNRPSVITLKELWDTKHKHNSGLRRTKIRSVDETTGEIFFNRIVDVFNNGIKSIYEVITLHGYHVRATNDHRFMADDGAWQELAEFCIGDNIAVNGRVDALPKICIECGDQIVKEGALRCRKCASKMENSSWNRKQAEEAATNVAANESSARQRWACQKDKNNSCERCGARKDAGVRLDLHHIDRNPHNNEPSNKLTLCCPCHMWIHSRHDYFGQPFQHRYVDYDEIASIEYIGEEEVFDLQLEAPNHNFIANGFVVHNCVAGPQVEVNWSLMTPDTDLSSFYPRKIWYREGKGIDAQYPAIRVYNIDSHIDELIKIIELFKSFGDEETTLPTWMIGQQVNNETAQATSGRNATVLVSIKDIVKNFDTFTEHIIRDIYAWNMDFNPRQDIKGDFKCKALGVSSLVMKEIRMQALTQLNSTLTPEQRDYIPEGEMIKEILKAHDIDLVLHTAEEVQKIRETRKQSIEMQLAVKLQEAEIGYKRSQTLAMLTKSKERNIEANIKAQTPIEQPEGSDPRLAEEELALQQTERSGKEAEIRRKEEKHGMDIAHSDEAHRVKIATEATKTAHDMAIKGKTAEHDMEMKGKLTEAGVKAKISASKTKPTQKSVKKSK